MKRLGALIRLVFMMASVIAGMLAFTSCSFMSAPHDGWGKQTLTKTIEIHDAGVKQSETFLLDVPKGMQIYRRVTVVSGKVDHWFSLDGDKFGPGRHVEVPATRMDSWNKTQHTYRYDPMLATKGSLTVTYHFLLREY